MEVYGHVVRKDKHGTRKQSQKDGRGPDLAPAHNRGRDHGAVADADLPQRKKDQCDAASAQEADDGRAVPRVVGATPRQRELYHDGEGGEKDEAEHVELFQGRQDAGLAARDFMGSVVGDMDEKKKNDCGGADGKVDIEA